MPLKPVKVSQLNNYISKILGTDPLIGNVRVEGEISNLKYHSSGHVFFSLKDEFSTIRCFMPANAAQKLRYEIDNGMNVIVSGYISVYEKGGYYSLNIRELEAEGRGTLAIAFDKVREKLEKEGVFSAEHKKPIPPFAMKIAIITSQTGAALQDMLKIIRSRNNVTDILIFPSAVQGNGAALQIAKVIDRINSDYPEVEIIIAGRGGGSQEDLWAFNEECVARAIYNSKIPVISAVGHETDFTIADFAADVRAETPTAAATMAAFDTEALKNTIGSYRDDMKHSVMTLFDRYREILNSLKGQLQSLDPQRLKKMGLVSVVNEDGKSIRSIHDTEINETLYIKFEDGQITVQVTALTEADKK